MISSRLQVAIDVTDAKEAQDELSKICSSGADVFEIGRPLISTIGVSAVELFTRYVPAERIYADVKCIDFPISELSAFVDAGVQEVSILAAMPDCRLRELVGSTILDRAHVVVSFMGYPLDSVVRRCELLKTIGFREFVCHGAGEHADAFREVMAYLEILREIPSIELSAAGGINSSNVSSLEPYDLTRIIVGRGVTKDPNPLAAVANILTAVRNGQ